MITNQYICAAYPGVDASRMGAQVISGIGFLGAGTIVVTGLQKIKGLTTAAGLWVVACIGLALGTGFYMGGIITTVLCIIINTLQTPSAWLNICRSLSCCVRCAALSIRSAPICSPSVLAFPISISDT